MGSKYSSWDFSTSDLLRVYIKSVQSSSPKLLANLKLVCNLVFSILHLEIKKRRNKWQKFWKSIMLGD